MYVCVCKEVTDRQIRAQVASGCASFEEIQVDLGVATRCGQCADFARELVAEASGGTMNVTALAR